MPTAHNTAGRHPRSIWRFLRDVLVIFLAALVLSFLVKTYLVPREDQLRTLLGPAC
jgi:signal peptidase I